MVKEQYWRAVFIYIISCVGVILTGLPATGPFAMAAGFLFGIPLGVLYTIIAAVIGSCITVLIVRLLLAATLHDRYQARLDQFNQYMAQYGHSYLVSLHLLTVVPLIVINVLAALADVPMWVVVWTTIAGSVPVYLLYVIAGKELFALTGVHEVFKPHIIILFLMLALIALLPIILKRLKGVKRP